MFMVFCAYCRLRYIFPENEILPQMDTSADNNYQYQSSLKLTFILMNTLLVVFMIVKAMFFATVNSNFGILVELISKVIRDMGSFTLLFLLAILMFDLLFYISGTAINSEEYKNVNIFFYYFIQIFRNALGNIGGIKDDFWMQFEDKLVSTSSTGKKTLLRDANPSIAYFVQGYNWLLWVLNIFFLLVMMLNFLIAVISQSYDNVMTKSMFFVY